MFVALGLALAFKANAMTLAAALGMTAALLHVAQARWLTQSAYLRVTAHREEDTNTLIGPVNSGEVLQKGIHLLFETIQQNGALFPRSLYTVHWQVTNTDHEAWVRDELRGEISQSKPNFPSKKWERTAYHGIHWVQAFVISKRSKACVAQTDRFFVVIE